LKILLLCKAYKVKTLYVFGSAVSGSFNEKSDIDFLITFEDNLSVDDYTENYFSLQYKLRALFKREIDLVTQNFLSNPFLIQSINANKQLLYVKP